MKKIVAVLVALAVAAAAAAAFLILAIGAWLDRGFDECDPEILEALGGDVADLSPQPRGTSGPLLDVGAVIPGVPLPADNIKRAGWIAQVVEDQGLPYRAAQIALATSYVEALFLSPNEAQSDRDSAGPFQQRRPWGSLEERMDYRTSTLFFLYGGSSVPDGYSEPGLTDIRDWQDRPAGEVAQAVQRSAFPDRYAEKLDEADKILAHYGWEDDGSRLIAVDGDVYEASNFSHCFSSSETTMADVVRAALDEVGNDYSWGDPADGASFVSAMFESVGFDGVPSSIDDLVNETDSFEGDVVGQWVPVGDGSGFKPGDVLVWGPTSRETTREEARQSPERVAFYAGDLRSQVKVATYNVRGSSHTARTGPNSGPERAKKAAALIMEEELTVVGLQELQPNQRATLLRELGDSWAIWPNPPKYDGNPGNMALNSILWDTSQVELVQARDLPMPYYFAPKTRKNKIPLVKLRHLATGQEFWVTNTHDPAFAENAEKRYLNAVQHAADMDDLVATGLPVFMTGDFNSGFRLTDRGNRTWKNRRDNLTWCIMTASGTMINGYDASRNPPRLGKCPQETTLTKSNIIDHVYVSKKNVDVVDYEEINKARTASDHRVVIVTAVFGEAGSSTAEASWVGPNLRDGSIVVQPLRPAADLLGALRFSFASGASIDPNSEGWVLPVAKGSYTLTNPYGVANSIYASGYHTGEDFGTGTNEPPVYAVADGEIVTASSEGAYGNRLELELSDGSRVLYAHLSRMVVLEGPVKAGTVIGYVGTTGRSFGNHLHFEVITPDGRQIDPIPVLREKGLDP